MSIVKTALGYISLFFFLFACQAGSSIELEEYNVTIFHNVFLSLLLVFTIRLQNNSHHDIFYCLIIRWILLFKQEGPEGPGTLTWDWKFLRVPFFIALYTTGDTWGV